MAHIYLIVYWINFKHKHSKYITTITKGTRDSWNALKKATSITKKWYKNKELNLQFHQYCTCDFVEEKICNIIARLTYLGLMDHLHDFIYFPRYALISTYSHMQHRGFIKTFARSTTFSNKENHAMMQPTRIGCNKSMHGRILVTEIALLWTK